MKRVLSTQHQARVEIESLFEGEDFSETLTRARFEEVRKSHGRAPLSVLFVKFYVKDHKRGRLKKMVSFLVKTGRDGHSSLLGSLPMYHTIKVLNDPSAWTTGVIVRSATSEGCRFFLL